MYLLLFVRIHNIRFSIINLQSQNINGFTGQVLICCYSAMDKLSLKSTGKHKQVTRFGEISALSKILRIFGKLFWFLSFFGKNFSLPRGICNIIWMIFFVANGQILKNNLTIWSHCARCFSSVNISSCPKECNQELEVYCYIVYYITFFVPNCKTLFLNMGHYIMKLHKLKSVYVVLGNRTWCHLLVSTKGSSQLWRPPLCKPLLPSLTFL